MQEEPRLMVSHDLFPGLDHGGKNIFDEIAGRAVGNEMEYASAEYPEGGNGKTGFVGR
jgi:hypothetical protein